MCLRLIRKGRSYNQFPSMLACLSCVISARSLGQEAALAGSEDASIVETRKGTQALFFKASTTLFYRALSAIVQKPSPLRLALPTKTPSISSSCKIASALLGTTEPP